MAKNRAPSPFDALKYEKPKGDPALLAKAYVDEVSKIPIIQAVWGYIAETDAARVKSYVAKSREEKRDAEPG